MAKDTEYGQVEEGVSMAQEGTSRKNRRYANVPGSGVYRHPESGNVAIVQGDPLWGNTQAQAFTRLGFEYVRPAREDEVSTLPELAIKATTADQDTLKGLNARLDAVEQKSGEQADLLKAKTDENAALSDEVAKLREQLAAAEKDVDKSAKAETKAAKTAEKNKAATEDHIADAGAPATDAADESAEGAKKNAEQVTAAREAEKASDAPQGPSTGDEQSSATDEPKARQSK